jgi:hypothetical protein
VTTPDSAADVDRMLLLALKQAEKELEVRAVRPPGSLQVLRGRARGAPQEAPAAPPRAAESAPP